MTALVQPNKAPYASLLCFVVEEACLLHSLCVWLVRCDVFARRRRRFVGDGGRGRAAFEPQEKSRAEATGRKKQGTEWMTR